MLIGLHSACGTFLLPALAGRRALNQVVFRFAREGTIALAWRNQNA